jgi:hypothetical protein
MKGDLVVWREVGGEGRGYLKRIFAFEERERWNPFFGDKPKLGAAEKKEKKREKKEINL